jgi:hypothetical protein
MCLKYDRLTHYIRRAHIYMYLSCIDIYIAYINSKRNCQKIKIIEKI